VTSCAAAPKPPAFYVVASETRKMLEFPEPGEPDIVPMVLGSEEAKEVCDSHSNPHLLAVDCEMVRTSAGMELARVTFVNQQLETVLDELVVRICRLHARCWLFADIDFLFPLMPVLPCPRCLLIL